MPLTRLLRPLLLLALLLGAGASAWAQGQSQRAPRDGHAVGQGRPHARPHGQREHDDLSDAVRRAERAGQVLSAERVQYDGRDVNRVKIVDERGRVRVYWDDPEASRDGGDRPVARPSRDRTRYDDDDDPTL